MITDIWNKRCQKSAFIDVQMGSESQMMCVGPNLVSVIYLKVAVTFNPEFAKEKLVSARALFKLM